MAHREWYPRQEGARWTMETYTLSIPYRKARELVME